MSTISRGPLGVAVLAAAVWPGAAAAQAPAAAPAALKNLTLDDLYDPDKRVDFGGQPPSGITWLDDAHYLWPKTDAKARTTELLKVNAETGATTPFFDAAKVEATLAALEGAKPDDARRAARQRSYPMNQARTAMLVTVGSDLYHYDLGAHRATRLTRDAAKEEEATLSPDGRRAAFVRGNNLFVVDVGGQERALTQDGSENVLNGKLDWVYQEEIYGRGTFRAYWWSPDSQRLAFLRLDEADVPRYTLVDDIPTRPSVEVYPYPKAGDPNPKVKLAVASAAGGAPAFVDTAPYAGVELLIVDVDWKPDSSRVVWQAQDREQTWLDVNLTDPASGATRTLFRETTKAWVERLDSPHWLKDGSFLWQSERSGYRHLYHYGGDGTLRRPVTSGSWEARNLYGVDEARGLVYFSGTEASPIGVDVYRVKLDGSGLTRLSRSAGTHSANFNKGLTLYLDTWSDITTPQQVRLHRADGKEVRVVHSGQVKALQEYRLAKPELLQVPTRDGFLMEAMILKPPDFDPRRKYPVYQHTYGGPHAPQVRNAWGGTGYLFHQLLAQKGIVVWICDNRTASGKGAVSAWAGYKRMGESELRDVEDGVAWLKKQPFVDGERIGINGWSYGGFMASYALTHSKSFTMGIAGGSVTDWRNYDSIYTERYMRTPQNNPEGYKDTSVHAAAKDLSGRILLIHGAVDDNVHPQNTQQLAYELQKAGKPFRLMFYPKSQHGVTDASQVKHLRTLMVSFIEETLLGSAPAPTAGAAR
jgi:dipeptidyl-peptidase-4